jgi:hypothetical protein
MLPFKRSEDSEQRGVDEGAVPEVALITLPQYQSPPQT